MTVGALTVFLSYLTKFFKPVKDLANMTNSIAQTAVGVDRIRAILDADNVIPERPDARELPAPVRGEIRFDQVEFGYDPDVSRAARRQLSPSSRASWSASSVRPAAASRPSSA